LFVWVNLLCVHILVSVRLYNGFIQGLFS